MYKKQTKPIFGDWVGENERYMKKILSVAVCMVAVLTSIANVYTSATKMPVPKETNAQGNPIPFQIPPLVFGQDFDSVKALLKGHDWLTFEVIHVKKKKGIIELDSKINISRMQYWFDPAGKMYCVAIFVPKSEATYSDIRNRLKGGGYKFREIYTEIDQPFLFVNPDLRDGVQCEVETIGGFGELWQLLFTKMEN